MYSVVYIQTQGYDSSDETFEAHCESSQHRRPISFYDTVATRTTATTTAIKSTAVGIIVAVQKYFSVCFWQTRLLIQLKNAKRV